MAFFAPRAIPHQFHQFRASVSSRSNAAPCGHTSKGKTPGCPDSCQMKRKPTNRQITLRGLLLYVTALAVSCGLATLAYKYLVGEFSTGLLLLYTVGFGISFLLLGRAVNLYLGGPTFFHLVLVVILLSPINTWLKASNSWWLVNAGNFSYADAALLCPGMGWHVAPLRGESAAPPKGDSLSIAVARAREDPPSALRHLTAPASAAQDDTSTLVDPSFDASPA